MRLATVLIVMAVILLLICQSAIPGKVTVTQGGKSHEGWSSDRGKIVVTNPRGKTIMYGEVSRMGRIELTSTVNDETYVGQVNTMGQGVLMSPRTGETLRIELER
jgi:hypothetical protein